MPFCPALPRFVRLLCPLCVAVAPLCPLALSACGRVRTALCPLVARLSPACCGCRGRTGTQERRNAGTQEVSCKLTFYFINLLSPYPAPSSGRRHTQTRRKPPSSSQPQSSNGTREALRQEAQTGNSTRDVASRCYSQDGVYYVRTHNSHYSMLLVPAFGGLPSYGRNDAILSGLF